MDHNLPWLGSRTFTLILHFQKDFYKEKTSMEIFFLCPCKHRGNGGLGWGYTEGITPTPVVLRQSRGGCSPLNDPAAAQLPLCPLAAFHLSPKSGVPRSSPNEASWVTQAVVSGTGPRAELPPWVFAVGWAGTAAPGAELAHPCPVGCPAGMLMWGM